MMELEYSPHHPSAGVSHLLSPTHARGSAFERFSINQIRRSLSRSPSKPSRCHAFASAGHPISAPPSVACDNASRHKFSVRRTGPVRTASRKTSPNSPLRRALGDNHNSANTTPHITSRGASSPSDQENMDCEDTPPAFNEPIKLDFYQADRLRQRSRLDLASPMKSSPLKRSDGIMDLDAASGGGSPRPKRRSLHALSPIDVPSYGLDGPHSDSGESSTGSSTPTSAGAGANAAGVFSTWPATATQSPQKRPISLRKSTLQQRTGPARSRLLHDATKDSPMSPSLTRARSRISFDSALPLPAFDFDSPSRRNIHDDALLFPPPPGPKPYRSAPKPHPLSHAQTPSSSAMAIQDNPHHMLRFGAAPSARQQLAAPPPSFSKSLPIGALRPSQEHDGSTPSQNSSQESTFATPNGYRMAKPLPQAFMSTGLISKRNRNIDMASTAFSSSINMPDTPSKKAHVNITESPALPAAARLSHELYDVGSPSTPFSARRPKGPSESFGKSVSIFDVRANTSQLLHRGDSLLTFDDGADMQISPTQHPRLERRESCDDFPPTPTKSTSTGAARPHSRGKGNSLRSSIFGRRGSLAPDTFSSRSTEEALPAASEPSPSKSAIPWQTPHGRAEKLQGTSSVAEQKLYPFFAPSASAAPPSRPGSFIDRLTRPQSHDGIPVQAHNRAADIGNGLLGTVGRVSPHTPNDSFPPPDPSSISISKDKRPRTSFGLSSIGGFVPATPTGPRGEHSLRASIGLGHQSSSYFANDVDTALSSRFGRVTTLGIGEFSHVYRVEQPLGVKDAWNPSASTLSSPGGQVWAVKKSRKPYTGNKDRQRKLREVSILGELRGHEFLIELVDHWEAKNHLYIQTAFYENGNLKDFLQQTGFKGRLDDFRIWKILLELARGVKAIHDANFIHLDLKPANVFIDWEGVLKIGDFGMASAWPAPIGLDGEGDREYIGPEILSGRFDKPADVFAFGMIMLEIAGNIVLPDNGTSWQRLRAGDLSDLPSLTFSSVSSLARDASGEPISEPDLHLASNGTLSEVANSDCDDDLSFLHPSSSTARCAARSHDLVTPPNFMIDPNDAESLDHVVLWMISPDPDVRPRVDDLLALGGVQWVERRRRAGATVYEGAWGPADDVLDIPSSGCHVRNEVEIHAGGESERALDVEMLDS